MDEGKPNEKRLDTTEKRVLQYLKNKSANKYVKVDSDIVVIEGDTDGKKNSDIG